MEKYKSVKLKESTYRKLAKVAAELQNKLERPVTLDEAVLHALGSGAMRLSDTAGGWAMTEDEVQTFKTSLMRFWARWKPKRKYA